MCVCVCVCVCRGGFRGGVAGVYPPPPTRNFFLDPPLVWGYMGMHGVCGAGGISECALLHENDVVRFYW